MANDPSIQNMTRALALARRGQGAVEPNPMVGCVLVRDGQVIGQGYHRKFGGPHAEVEALRDCRDRGNDPAGCDVYVTLEPCCHFGKTPPCADALIAAKVGRVIAAMVDPFPRVAGGGIARLQAAGIATQVGVCEAQARELNQPFFKRLTSGLPWVMLKWAQTLDGRIATAGGDSQWISGPESRRLVHQIRGRVDAVMVGIGTALADDPQLTARDVRRRRLARRVVVDPRLRLPLESKLAQSVQDAPLTVATDETLLAPHARKRAELESLGVEVIGLPRRPGSDRELDLRPLLAHLAQKHQASNVLVEGGSTLAGALLEQGLVDQILAFIAPKLLADAAAIPAVRGRSIARMAHAMPLTLHSMRRIGDDVLLDYRLP